MILAASFLFIDINLALFRGIGKKQVAVYFQSKFFYNVVDKMDSRRILAGEFLLLNDDR